MRIASFALGMAAAVMVAAPALLVATPAMAAPANSVQADPRAKRADTRIDRSVQARVAARATTPVGKAEQVGDGGISLIALLVGGAVVGGAIALGTSGSPASP